MNQNPLTSRAFTLIELLASMAILALIMVMLFSAFEQISKAWTNGENRVETFTEARAILDMLSRELSQAIATSKITFHGEKNAVWFVAPSNADAAGQVDLCEIGYVFDNTIPNNITVTRHLTHSTDANWNFYTVPNSWWTTWQSAKDAVLANDTVLSLEFRYQDSNGNVIPAPFTQNKVPASVQIFLDSVDSRTVTKLKLVPNVGKAWETITNATLRSFSTVVYIPNSTP